MLLIKYFVNRNNTTIIGIGLTPEGLTDAYPTAELMLEMAWRSSPVEDVDFWFRRYATRRYGIDNKNASEAWNVLLPNILNSTSHVGFNGKLLISHLPSLTLNDFLWYNVSDVAISWDYFMNAMDELHTEEGYRYTFINRS